MESVVLLQDQKLRRPSSPSTFAGDHVNHVFAKLQRDLLLTSMLEKDIDALKAILSCIQDPGEKYCSKEFIRAEGGESFESRDAFKLELV